MELRQDGIRFGMKPVTNRSSGIELLRIFAILAVVTEHFIRQSGLLSGPNANSLINAFLGSGGRISVNIFVMIGAWFLVDKPFKAERPIRLYLEVVFYSIPLTFAMLVLGDYGSLQFVAQGLVPFFGRAVWFATAYISLILLSPFLNRVFTLPPQQQRLLMALLFVLYCLVASVPSFTALDYIADFSWFCVLYLFVGWAKHAAILDRITCRRRCLAAALLLYAFLCTLSVIPRLEWVGAYWLDNIKSLPNALCATLVFLFFLKSDIGTIRGINWCARSVFAVYIVHQVPAFQHFEWSHLTSLLNLTNHSGVFRAFGILGGACLVTFAISAIDFIRIAYLEPRYMNAAPIKRLAAFLDGLYAD
jgi:surface polysaccharide O-acyltransferase-like enzyme